MALADIPGYGAYVERKRQNEQAPLAELEQATKVVGLLQHMQQLSMTQKLAGGSMDSMSPDQLDALGQTLLLSGHPSASGVLNIADKKRKLASDAATLKSMQSGPAKMIQPDVQENEQAADQGTPAVAAATVPGAGGIFSTLAASDNPQIAAQAKMLQAQMDKADSRSIPPTYWQTQQSRLAKEQADYAQQRSMREFAIANRQQPAGGVEAPAVTDDTLAMDAWRYLTDGTLPPNMGRGVQGTAQATKIRNEAARLAKDMGMTPDEIRFAQLTNKTGIQAIGQLARARAQILQFEKTANANADLATQASERVDRTGIPILNKYIQAGRTATGDPETAKFHAATETFVSEYARVMSGGYGAAQTTESAQTRAHTLLNTANTKEQFRQVVGQLKTEMGNRVKALNDQMNEERGRLQVGTRSAKPEGAPVARPSAAPAAQAITATGPNGEKLILKDGQWQPVK